MPQNQDVRAAFRRAMTVGEIGDAVCGANRICVGFSGGADSTALLSLCTEYCFEQSIPLTAIHVHHGIRGEEADADAEACRNFCDARGIELLVYHQDAPAYAAEHGIGLEEAARQIRYRVFADVLRKYSHAVLATAHSADDNLETVLFHMIRGSGSTGLAGIPPVRERYIRPLLSVSAKQIRDFCAAEGLAYRTDSTNNDTSYTRNFIRGEIVPQLSRIHPMPEQAVARMSMLLRRDEEYLRIETERALGEYVAGTKAPLSCLLPMHDAVLSRACVRLYENTMGGRRDLAQVHIDGLITLLRRGGRGELYLPGGIIARVGDGFLSFLQEDTVAAEPSDFYYPLTPGEHFFPKYGFGVAFFTGTEANVRREKNIYKLSICTSMSFATIQGTLFLRFRRPGDTIRYGGMTRQVKKLLNAAALPLETRETLPFVCDDAGILWIPGFPARDGADSCEKIFLEYFVG